ncbi:hypothetical protein OAF34_01130 [Pirellulaceae bacterium]|jgi:hypothetical protein|nr:hypothetical protein [Pirellulaceae bacterium]
MNIENKLARDQIATCFDLLLEHFEKSIGNVERRTRERVNYPLPVYLTPWNSGAEPDANETFGVIGRQLSERGFDFFHYEPIPFKTVVVSFEYSPGRFVALRMKLTWCRFGRHGYFENGGVFLDVVDSPLGAGPF